MSPESYWSHVRFPSDDLPLSPLADAIFKRKYNTIYAILRTLSQPLSPAEYAVTKDRFTQKLKQPRLSLYEALANQLVNLVTVCRTALNNKPHLEFLLNQRCNSSALLDIITHHSHLEVQALFQDIAFDPDAAGEALLSSL